MKIAFRHVPFTKAQRTELDALAASKGYETLWCGADAPDAADLQDCEVLMGYFPPDLLAKLPALQWVQTSSAGVDTLCGVAYPNDDVVLTNCSGAFGIAISEYLTTGLLMLLRHMPLYLDNQRKRLWAQGPACGSIYGSRITVVGLGNIGSEFARRMTAFGANVTGVCRTRSKCPSWFPAENVVLSEQLEAAVADADVVACCLPGTPQTAGMISERVIAAMKNGALLLNVGRGATVDEAALVRALENGKLGGAVLDVAQVEPLPQTSKLWTLPNVIVTPHISGRNDDPINALLIYEIFRENLAHYLASEPLTHVVNRKQGY